MYAAETMASQASRKHAADTPVIPDRLYFKIGDVARICGVETYVLRFWESQFPQLKPNKSGTGQRLYRRRDVELVLEIKRLVHGQGYTLAGARQALEGGVRKAVAPAPEPVRTDARSSKLAQIRNDLRDIVSLLEAPQPTLRRERAKVIKVRPESDSLFPL